jgi:uncharacterized protein YdeI (YjbR/CyaY-like superfamily)
MLLKDGDTVPPALLVALESDTYALSVFTRMRPSCQKRYALKAAALSSDETANRRVESIIAEIRKYGQRHNY